MNIRKSPLAITFSLLICLLAACTSPTPPPATMTPIPMDIPVPTHTPTLPPTATPTATATPTQTPTSTEPPTPTEIPTPTPEPLNLYGGFQFTFVPYNNEAEIPSLPYNFTLIFINTTSEDETRVPLTGADGNFAIRLDPGAYRFVRFELEAPDLSEEPITLFVYGGTPLLFNVSETGCVNIGQFSVSYYILPVLTFEEQIDIMQKEAGENGVLFTTTAKGSLFLDETVVQDLPESASLPGLESCSVEHAAP